MAELANCSRCDNLFVKGVRDICQNCYKREEEAFQKVYQFLRQRKNREATLSEIVQQTGVDEELIIKFVKEKRLRPTEFPNVGYPCEKCGEVITSGKLCQRCSEKLKQELQRYEEHEQRMKQEQKKDKVKTYYMFDK
ncbi:MAG: TIGR03826 family flagellar region protein [Bacillota bacterium]|uniref:Flagellar operon protein TIGR03826 n=1 Tax=Virgibacillus salarius TaxID=447199 RepID=A0A941DYW1_9BACI|nr:MULTISPECIES: TIGR03826 family flagellar region protein [Bacillaceae]NAZ10587.1 hypothetical protein [Agaribacter marinus]MBR7797877.1 hypothetical protein [Virgibacillus salarius]MCC2251042.1 hypothetical protein [Virgibacillus sp. AGTR]MDY7042864.1 hypothetical protein [Virgibacillus sp. M23]QRZ18044.1 hypothetical protein JUJ52_20380 [Virgibacillus sp. AGTR]